MNKDMEPYRRKATPEIPAIGNDLGYASRKYVESLAEFGEPIMLPRSGGFLLKRRIRESNEYDAMGCYPLFFCQDWCGLTADLRDLPEEVVSVSLVADPFGEYSKALLDECFDVVNPFKEHYIVNLDRDPEQIGSLHHRKLARRALRRIQVEECKEPAGFVDDWCNLYGNLVKRYAMSGIRAFSKRAFKEQLSMPEIVVHQAFLDEELVGAQLFFVRDGVAQCHLGAVSEKGYATGAFYALDFFSFRFFTGTARKLDLGGGAGLSVSSDDGLVRYKRGWCSETRPVYFCGRIVNSAKYAELQKMRPPPPDSCFFPAYRAGEID